MTHLRPIDSLATIRLKALKRNTGVHDVVDYMTVHDGHVAGANDAEVHNDVTSTSSTTDVDAADDAARHAAEVDNAGVQGVVRVRVMMKWLKMLI